MKGELILTDSIEFNESEFEILPSLQDFALSIYVNDQKTIKNQLKNKAAFDYCIKYTRRVKNDMNIVNEKAEKEITYIEKHFDNILDSIEYIKLLFNEYDIKEFIKENPILLSKKIVLPELLKITDYERVLELIDEYKDISDNIYVSLDGNDNYVSLIDSYKTIVAIKNQADLIKKLNLSPMETIMYVYDQVRNRVYKYESATESSFKSRDLSEVIFGDKIVCVGYANIFCTLLKYLEIDSRLVDLVEKDDSNNQFGHMRNIIYVNDPKYDIDGVYYFDPTWDSKKSSNDKSFLTSYRYFAKTREYMDKDNKYKFEDVFFPKFSLDMCEKLEKILKEEDIDELIPYIKSLNYMASLVNKERLIDIAKIFPWSPMYEKIDINLFFKKFRPIFNKFNNDIPAETMIRLLNNVRKIEYYQNPELYPYSIQDICNIFMKSHWKFKNEHLSSKMKFYRAIFGDEEKVEIKPIDNFRNFANENKLFEEIEHVIVAKVLQKTLIKIKKDY